MDALNALDCIRSAPVSAHIIIFDTPTLRRRLLPCESGELVVTERLQSVRGCPVWTVKALRIQRREAA